MSTHPVREQVSGTLRRPVRLAVDAWPTGPGWRAAAFAAAPFVAVMLLVVLWLLGVVVLSTLGALGVEPVDLDGSLHYVRDTVLFVLAGAVAVLLWVLVAAAVRVAADRRRGTPAVRP
jgi:hypothetical protein